MLRSKLDELLDENLLVGNPRLLSAETLRPLACQVRRTASPCSTVHDNWHDNCKARCPCLQMACNVWRVG